MNEIIKELFERFNKGHEDWEDFFGREIPILLKEERIKTLEEERNRIYSYIEDLLISEDNELLGKLSNIIFDKEINNLKN